MVLFDTVRLGCEHLYLVCVVV